MYNCGDCDKTYHNKKSLIDHRVYMRKMNKGHKEVARRKQAEVSSAMDTIFKTQLTDSPVILKTNLGPKSNQILELSPCLS